MEPAYVLKIESLNAGWHDNDHVMLHACFQLLKDCIVKEDLFDGHIDWNFDERHRKTKAELIELHEWRKERTRDGSQNGPRPTDQYEKENEMLIRLINLSSTLSIPMGRY
jgi:hypothetical protein